MFYMLNQPLRGWLISFVSVASRLRNAVIVIINHMPLRFLFLHSSFILLHFWEEADAWMTKMLAQSDLPRT